MERKLSDFERSVLAALAEDGGFLVKHISDRADHPYCRDNRRARSKSIYHTLRILKERGLVDYLDQLKPACWKRTPNGTAALEASSQPFITENRA